MARRQVATVLAADPCCGSILESPLTEVDAAEHAAGFAALGDPARLRLLSLIATAPAGEVCVCDLVEPIGKSQPTVSHHLKKLREAGLLESERRGTWVYYRVSPGVLAMMAQLLAPADA